MFDNSLEKTIVRENHTSVNDLRLCLYHLHDECVGG